MSSLFHQMLPTPSLQGSPSDWQLLGEGNANAVYSYHGDDPALVCAMGNQPTSSTTHTHTQQVGWVLRIDKGHTFMPEPGPLLDAMRALEHELWAPYPPISDAPDGTHRLPSTLPTHHLHTQPCIDGRRM